VALDSRRLCGAVSLRTTLRGYGEEGDEEGGYEEWYRLWSLAG
jgi:hypothetical protein